MKPRRILLVEMNEDGTVGGSHQAQFDLVRLMDRERFQPVGPGTVVTPETGITYSVEDPDELAAALTRLVRDPELLRRLGANASARAEEFDARVMVQEVQKVYSELLGEGGG